MSIFREVVGAVCCCCVPDEQGSEIAGLSPDLKRLSDWRAHPALRQFDLESHIADGGFSEVWLARTRSTGEAQCLKVVNLRKPGLLPEDVEVLRGEARFLRLLDHPGLLRCRDVFETKYHMVMVLEYLSGGQMLDHLHRVDHYSEGQAARLFAQVAGAVAYMHNLNIVHRDIKPENVMFARPVDECVAAGRQLRVKLIDLGMATVLVPSETTQVEAEAPRRAAKRRRRAGGTAAAATARREPPRGCLGSPGFIAPEIVHGAVHTPAMDVYALGVLLFAMLTGRKPWSLRDSRNLSYAERSIRDAPALKDPIFLSLSAAARELLLAMLADDPRDRPSCMGVLRHRFMTQSLAATGAKALRQPPLDDAIKRRFAQLASLRRFRGLAFAMMASRQQSGQDLADFTKQLTERRRELHKDLLVRAKTRQSTDRQRQQLGPQQQQQQQDADTKHRESERTSSTGGGTQKRAHLQQQQQQYLQTGRRASAAAATAAAPSPDGRLSIDSACSQQPLLRMQHRQVQQLQLSHQHQPSPDGRRSFQLSTASTLDDASNRSNQPNQHLRNQPNYQLHQRHGQQWLQVESSRRSLDSLASSASSRQPLMAGAAGGGGGEPPLPSHDASHLPLWMAGSDPPVTASPAGPGGGAGVTGVGGGSGAGAGAGGVALGGPHRGAPAHPYHRSNSHHLHRQVLYPVAEPGETAGGSTRPGGTAAAAEATAAAAAPPPAGTSGSCNSRGWSSSGRPPVVVPPPPAAAAAPPPPPRQFASRPRPFVRESELELAALDPLALIRELPAAEGIRLGRAHSAPESLATSLLAFGSDADRRGGGCGAARAGGGGAAGVRGGGPDPWLDRLALGADMRAASANSWTLDLLGNADLLLALTGVPLAQQISCTTLDPSFHGAASYSMYGNGSPAPAPSGGRLSAATVTAALERLRSDAARSQASPSAGGGGGGARESSSHQLALALMAIARAASSSHGGSATTVPDGGSVAAAPPGGWRSSGRDGWPPRSVFATAAAAAAAAAVDTPTRSAAVDGGTLPAPLPDGLLFPFPAVSHSDVTLLPAGGSQGARRPSQPRALFAAGGCGIPPLRPSLEGMGSARPSLLLLSGAASGDAVADRFGLGAAAAAGSGEPLPLLRSVRCGGGDAGNPGGLSSALSCDVPYTSLHLSASSRHLGVALPGASASPAAAAAAATVAAAESAAGLTALATTAAVVLERLVRRPSIALPDLDERIAARRASLEQSFHGGKIWYRMGSGTDQRASIGSGGSAAAAGSPAAAAFAAAAAAATAATLSGGDSSGHRRSSAPRGIIAHSPGGVNAAALPGLLQELRGALGSGAAGAAAGPPGAMGSPPSLARITECSDLGDPSGSEAGRSARALDVSTVVAPPPPPPPPAGRPPLAAPPPRRGAAAGYDGAAAACAPPAPAPARARWRSPFEALAAEPVAADPESADKSAHGAGR